jgi:general secretion pathway protein L
MKMATNTVGLDIGRTAIKAVRLRRTLSGRETVDFLCQDIPLADQNMGEARQSQLLKHFVKKHRLAGSRLMTALPCSDLMIRTLALPFHDTRKLLQVVPSEVESMIPLPLEDVAVDYELLTQRKPDKKTPKASGSQVLVAAAQTSTLLHHVEHLANAGLEPDAIRVDALALFSVVRRMSQRQSEPLKNVAMVDIGATRTTLCLSFEGDPWVLRTIRYGTNHLNQLNQRAAQGEGLAGPNPAVQKRPLTVEQMEPGFSTLLREIRSTLHAYEASTRHRLKYVWFSGGGAELSELTALLARCLELESISLPGLYRVSCAPAYAVAMGLALMGKSGTVSNPWRGKSAGSAINLRRVMNSTFAQSQEWRRSLWRIGVASLGVLLFAISDLSIQMVLKQSRLQELKAELRAQFHKRFAGVELVTDELDQAKGALQAVRKTTSLLSGEHVAMLPLLTDLVRQLPKGIMVKINGLTIEPKAIQIEAETDSFESMEKIRQGLLGFPDAREVVVRDARVGSSPNQVLFRISVARGAS